MALKIITDSAADLPKWVIEEFGLHVIPTPVVINEEDCLDGETILPSDFYGLSHGDDLKTLETVKGMLNTTYGCTKFIETYVGCAIGAHTGPGIIGITFLDEASPYE